MTYNVPLMKRNTYPFQIKDPVNGIRARARFIAPREEEIEGRLAAWEILPLPPLDEAALPQAA